MRNPKVPLLVVLTGCLLLSSCGKKEEPPAEPAPEETLPLTPQALEEDYIVQKKRETIQSVIERLNALEVRVQAMEEHRRALDVAADPVWVERVEEARRRLDYADNELDMLRSGRGGSWNKQKQLVETAIRKLGEACAETEALIPSG